MQNPSPPSTGNAPSFMTARQMTQRAAEVMEGKATQQHSRTFLLAIMAGLFIGLGFVYCTIANVTGAGKIVGGLVFSLGLTLVIVLGADLFTSTTLTLIVRASRKISWRRMFANWGVVYVGNFIGSIVLVALILLSGHPWANDGQVALFCIKITQAKLSYTFTEAFFLGVMCNIMVCLGVWMSYSGRTFVDKMAACLFPVGLFISCSFEHSVANMYMIPLGILCNQLLPASLVGAVADPSHVNALLTWKNFFFSNLLPVSLGNILGGGIFVGMYHWYIYLRPEVSKP